MYSLKNRKKKNRKNAEEEKPNPFYYARIARLTTELQNTDLSTLIADLILSPSNQNLFIFEWLSRDRLQTVVHRADLRVTRSYDDWIQHET